MRNANIKKTTSVDLVVTALCRDFPRRAVAIENQAASSRTLTEFRYLNFKILEAVSDVVEDNLVTIFIKEIGENIGYANTKIEGLSEVAYKTYKKLIKERIAKKLHLAD
jgi:hypothetical protein